MPYIGSDRKERLELGEEPVNAGELTYVIQQQLEAYLRSHGLAYQALAECLGALEGAKADLLERVVKPYEEKKRLSNGDVWPEFLTRGESVTAPRPLPPGRSPATCGFATTAHMGD